jgi:acetolactate synthase I/III small subunit
MIIRAPDIVWPAKGCPKGRGWMTVSLMARLILGDKCEGTEPPSLAAWVARMKPAGLGARPWNPLFSFSIHLSDLVADSMRHIIAILLQNEAGALTRVAGLFSTRGYNIESLSVAPTDDPTVSRLTLVTTGSDAVMQQITNQLNKLVDVVSTEDMTGGEHLERELVLLKLKVRPEHTDAVRGYVVRTGGRVLDPATDGFIVELTASEMEINAFVSDLAQQAELLEVVRSGALGIGRNARPLRVVR